MQIYEYITYDKCFYAAKRVIVMFSTENDIPFYICGFFHVNKYFCIRCINNEKTDTAVVVVVTGNYPGELGYQ